MIYKCIYNSGKKQKFISIPKVKPIDVGFGPNQLRPDGFRSDAEGHVLSKLIQKIQLSKQHKIF